MPSQCGIHSTLAILTNFANFHLEGKLGLTNHILFLLLDLKSTWMILYEELPFAVFFKLFFINKHEISPLQLVFYKNHNSTILQALIVCLSFFTLLVLHQSVFLWNVAI